MGIKHAFVSGKANASDTSKVRPQEWNADHTIDSDVNLNSFGLIDTVDGSQGQRFYIGDGSSGAFNFDLGSTGSVFAFNILTSYGGTFGPKLNLYHGTASAAANDTQGWYAITGNDSAGTPSYGCEILGILVDAAPGTYRTRLNFDTVSGGSGNPTTVRFSCDSDGIKFFTDTAAANALSDYERGTFNPTLSTDGTGFSSVSYDGTRQGYYVKIGDAVFISGRMRTSSVTVGSATGNVVIASLPFTIASHIGSIGVSEGSGWTTNTPMSATYYSGESRFYLEYRTSANGAISDIPVSSVSTGASGNSITFGGWYSVT